ncbi:MAG: cell wall hydrolase [Clostridia bacterium]|nr:cell wall hydrolase [Clostridia bacterium]
MKTAVKKIIAVILICVPLISAAAVKPAALGEWKRRELSTMTVNDTNIYNYKSVKMTLLGVDFTSRARLINEVTYVPLRDFTDAVTRATVTYYASTKTATVKATGLDVSATAGTNIVYANSRPLFSLTPTKIMSDGKMYVPVRTLVKAFGLSLTWDAATSSVSVTGEYSPLTPASEYYNKDDVYWLSRIISAESAGEPLLGQIAVGNVVLNRVRSSDYPSSIYGVIFDRKWGVQFSPVANGTIYNSPYYTSVIAARICLEGISVSGDVLYFMEPRISSSSWIKNNRYYAFSIGNHDFYY